MKLLGHVFSLGDGFPFQIHIIKFLRIDSESRGNLCVHFFVQVKALPAQAFETASLLSAEDWKHSELVDNDVEKQSSELSVTAVGTLPK